jgi:His-Xaa-Ser system radical SAM maturase HxsC
MVELMVDWPLTFKCNNNCLSCIYNMEIAEKLKVGQPMEESIKKVIDGIRPGNTLGLTGGEPTIRDIFFKILRYAKKKDPEMNVFIVSNGRMFSYMEFAEKMAGIGLSNLKIGIALYGHESRIHEAVTRIPGSFEQTLKGIKNLLELGIPVELRIIVSKLNYEKLEQIVSFVAKELKGVYRVVLINMKYTGNAYINRKALFVRYGEVVPFAQKAADVLMKNDIDVKLFHFPLCTVKKRYRVLAKGVTKQESELMFVRGCGKCCMKDECPRIWKSYWVLAGGSEFRAIENV